MNARKRWYVGRHRDKPGHIARQYSAFGCVELSAETSNYGLIIGPFRTKRAAIWAAENPSGYVYVSEAERKAREKVQS